MPRPWGPLSMMYPPYPPWAGWYGQCTPPPTHFHPRWSGPAEGFSHRRYYTGDGRYRRIGHQQGRKAPRQENWAVRNDKSDHPVPLKATEALGQPHRQSVWGSKDAWRSGGNQVQTGPRSETSADDEAKHDTEKGPEAVAAK
jgi:hypothetical protein